ncbi:hypothetical protein LguiB_030303 [Lonicera macranthoides]
MEGVVISFSFVTEPDQPVVYIYRWSAFEVKKVSNVVLLYVEEIRDSIGIVCA